MGRNQLEDALARGEYDFLYIDGQHTAFSDDQLVAFCATAEALGLPVQFRIPHTRHTYLIGRYFDLGLTSVLVPEVDAEATVDEAVACAYYPPPGRRSWGGTARRGIQASRGQVERLTYAAWWNTRVVLAIQLESVEAIINARRLAKPGVDFVTFGPNDLLFSLEAHPEFPLRTVDACVRHVAGQLKDSVARLGVPASMPGEPERYLDMGATVFL